jgi:hypothetical protein
LVTLRSVCEGFAFSCLTCWENSSRMRECLAACSPGVSPQADAGKRSHRQPPRPGRVPTRRMSCHPRSSPGSRPRTGGKGQGCLWPPPTPRAPPSRPRKHHRDPTRETGPTTSTHMTTEKLWTGRLARGKAPANFRLQSLGGRAMQHLSTAVSPAFFSPGMASANNVPRLLP